MVDPLTLAKRVAAQYAELQQVLAVALAGSQAADSSDKSSDVDLYVYVSDEIPIEQRERIAREGSLRPEVGNTFFEPGDEWIDDESGLGVDVMFRRAEWIQDQLDRVLVRHEASMGYSTCFWHNVLNSNALFHRNGWFQKLQVRARQPYPPDLRRAIIAKNFPFLRDTQSSYLHQIEVSSRRGDLVAVNHRVAAFLASYFDVIFALNMQPHPGEKRLVQFVERLCEKRPANLREDVEAFIAQVNGTTETLVHAANRLVNALEALHVFND